MSPRGLLSVAPFIFIILVCVPNSLGKPTADRDVPETIEVSVILPETIEVNEESVTLPETNSTTLPETNSTTLPETNSTTLPETNSTTLPETNSTTLPETDSTSLPETIEESTTLAETENPEEEKDDEVGSTFTLTTFKLKFMCPK